MTIHAYPYPPLQPTGDWIVRLPGEASIGEVIVYASTTVIPSTADYEWRFDGSLAGTNGADPFSTPAGGAYVPALRGDGAGQALSFGGASGTVFSTAAFPAPADAGFASVIVIAAPPAFVESQVNYGHTTPGLLNISRSGSDVKFRQLTSGGVVIATASFTNGGTVVAAMYHDVAAGKVDVSINGVWTDAALSMPGTVLADGMVQLRVDNVFPADRGVFDECAVWVGPHDRSVIDAYIAQLL